MIARGTGTGCVELPELRFMRELVGLCSTLAVRGVVAREAVDYQHTSVRPWVVSAVPALSPVDGGATLAAPGGVAAARVREGGGGGFGVDGVRSGVFCGNGRLGELEEWAQSSCVLGGFAAVGE